MIELIPYVKVNDEWTIPDHVMAAIYYQMQIDGTLKTVFYDGKMNSPEELVSMMQDSLNLPVIVLVDKKVSGIYWLNGVAGNYAFAHFCAFKETWGKCTKEIAERVLDYWFSFKGSDGYLFDVLLGMIPEFNERAIRYAEDVGFCRVGVIPKMARKKDSMVVLYRMRN